MARAQKFFLKKSSKIKYLQENRKGDKKIPSSFQSKEGGQGGERRNIQGLPLSSFLQSIYETTPGRGMGRVGSHLVLFGDRLRLSDEPLQGFLAALLLKFRTDHIPAGLVVVV